MNLVEYSPSDILSGWMSAPPSDRVYMKNEIIACIGVLNVPAEYDVYADGYRAVVFKGTQISLNVMDNWGTVDNAGVTVEAWLLNHSVPSNTANVPNWNVYASPTAVNAAIWDGTDDGVWFINDGNNQLIHYITGTGDTWRIPVVSSAKTYRFLVFGKVVDDDAELSFTLTRNERFNSPFSPPILAGTPRANTLDVLFQNAVTRNTWNQGYNPSGLPGGGAPDGRLPILNNDNTSARPGYGRAGAPEVLGMLILSEDLLVGRTVDADVGANRYYIWQNTDAGFAFDKTGDEPGDLLFVIDTGSRGVTTALYMYPNGVTGTGYRIHIAPSTQELIFIKVNGSSAGDQIRFGTAGYTGLIEFYRQWFEGALNFTAYNEGNLLNASDWEAIAETAGEGSATSMVAIRTGG